MGITPQGREARRNFLLGVLNGAIFRFARGLIEPPLVLTWFVGQLTSSNLLVGLVVPLGNAGWFLPQIFASARVQRMKRKMPVYATAAVIRLTVWGLLAATVWLVDDPVFLLVSFFILFTVARLASGPAGLAFFDVVAKTVPARRRGRLFAGRLFLGSVLAVGASWIVKVVLDHPDVPFPHGIAILFTFYCAMLIPTFVSFMAIREPPGAAIDEPIPLGRQLRRAGRLLRENWVYRRHTTVRLFLSLTTIVLPFYGLYASSVLQAGDGMVGVYTAAGVIGELCSNPVWGLVSDRKGNRLAIRLLTAGKGLTALLALMLVGLVAALGLQGTWLPYLALPLFFLDGALRPAQILTGSNFLMELVPEAERSIYLGLSNTLNGVVTLLSVLGGLLVDLLGFAGLFATALALCLAGYALATGLPEPREMEA